MEASLAVTFGLVGRSLRHSYSPQFFNDKFSRLGLPYRYETFEMASLEDLRQLPARYPALRGLNITVPYKQEVVRYLDRLEGPVARALSTVNCIRIEEGVWSGFNTDVAGIRHTLAGLVSSGPEVPVAAVVLGTGGAAQAVGHVLERGFPQAIPYLRVSRTPTGGEIGYSELTPQIVRSHLLVVQTTPVGMYPDLDGRPDFPYEALTPAHRAFDLIYNPPETRFLAAARKQGARTANGLEMLRIQAEESWAIWERTAAEGAG